MKKISDFGFILIYILSISFSALLISSESHKSSINIKNIEEISSEMSEEKILKIFFPSDCLASSTLSDQYSCSNLYDDQYNRGAVCSTDLDHIEEAEGTLNSQPWSLSRWQYDQ